MASWEAAGGYDPSDRRANDWGGDVDRDEDDNDEWMQLLMPRELWEVQELDRARIEVERQIIHSNQAKLAGTSVDERRGRAVSVHRTAGSGLPGQRDDVMSHLYAQDVDVEVLAKLLPRPGDGEKQEQLAWQKGMDMMHGITSGSWFTVMSILVTAASVYVYLYETTLDIKDDATGAGGWTRTDRFYPGWFLAVEGVFLVYFGAELVLRALLADLNKAFWTSRDTVVDVLSVLPSVLFEVFDLRLWGFLRFLRLFRWSDIALLVEGREMDDEGVRRTDLKADGVHGWTRNSLVTMLRLLVFVARFVLVFAGAALLLDRAEGGIEDISEENLDEPLDFSSAVYMAAMTLSTVGGGGYGPVPVSPFARLAVSLAVLLFLPLAAVRVAEVVRHSSSSTTVARSTPFTPGVQERHVVACGSVTASNLKARLQELFHADHGAHNVRWVRVVVLSPEPPSPSITALIQSPRYRGRVTYVEGSPLDDDSLTRADVDASAAVMVLANKAARSAHAEDMNLSLQAISVLTHVELARRQGHGPRLLVELIDPDAALHLRVAGISQVISSAHLKLSVLAQSCLCPGWSAVVANLLESRAALPPRVLQQGSWLAEYYVGAKKTFYSVEFSPAFLGILFADAVVHIFEHFELILVAVETRRTEDGDTTVIVNPPSGYRIEKGDRGFVLAESQMDARVIWDYMAKDGRGGGAAEEISKLSRFSSPEEEEALALETLGVAGIAAMGPQAFVDSMIFSRTLLHCQRRLPIGEAPDAGLVLEWARHFQESDGMSDETVVRRVLAASGLVPPLGLFPMSRVAAAASAASATSPTSVASRAVTGSRSVPATPATSVGDRASLSAVARTETPARVAGSENADLATPMTPVERDDRLTGEDGLSTVRTVEVSSLNDEGGSELLVDLRSASTKAALSPATPNISTPVTSPSAKPSAVPTVSTPSVATTTAAAAAAATATPASTVPSRSPIPSRAQTPSPVPANTEAGTSAVHSAVGNTLTDGNQSGDDDKGRGTSAGGDRSGRQISTARHMTGHVVVLGFPPRTAHLECFLRPLKGWTGGSTVGGGSDNDGGGVSVVLVTPNVDELERTLDEVDRHGYVNTSEVYLLRGSLVSQHDLENSGVRTAKAVLLMKDRGDNEFTNRVLDDPLHDAESLLSFMKMEDGLLTPNQHVVVELESSSNVRFLHTKADAKSLRAIAGLGGAGAGGAADEAHYLWPKFAAGMTYNSSFIDSMFGQAFYRPSRIALIERLVLLDRWDREGIPGDAPFSATSNDPQDGELPSSPHTQSKCCLRQMAVPPSFLGHSFGEMFQHLAAPPLRCVAFALLRARGTRSAPEPYVYTGPRADTVLHRGDRVFVLGHPPPLQDSDRR